MADPVSDEAVVVLLAEDETLVRMFAADALQDAGYHVVESRDGLEALAILQLRPEIRALITDLVMPNLDGLSLIKTVRDTKPAVTIVVTTGALPERVEQEFPPDVALLRKPYTANKLVETLEAALQRLSAAPVAVRSIPTMQPGHMHGAGGLAHPLAEPDE
jgi:two-component system, response regulator PdtaR